MKNMASTFYENDMSKLSNEYNACIAQAKNTSRRNGYVPSKEEYEYYVSAAEIAHKISNLNVQQRAVCKQWAERATNNEKKAMELLKVLAPDYGRKAEVKTASDTDDQPVTSMPKSSSSTKAENQLQTTVGNFTTRNASEDVPAETIEKWYQKQPNHGFDDIVGMDDLKATIKSEILNNIGWDSTDELLHILKSKSFLFYGPFGTGKTFFIEAIAKELMEKGFKFIKLSGSDVHDSYVGVGEKKVNTAIREAVDNAPCVLFFDEIDNMCARIDGNTEGHEKRLSIAFRESYDMIVNSNKPIVFLAATNYPDRIDSAMLSRIKEYILVPLPSEEVRYKYFDDFLKKTKIKCSDDISVEDMVDATDNYSFRDLQKVTDGLKSLVKKKAKEEFSVYDENKKILQKESDENVADAIIQGKIMMTKELFDSVKNSISPEKKSDILASLEAFEKKI